MSTQSYAHALPQDEAPAASALSSRRGAAILLLLCLVQFMDVLDASILNIALPSIRRDLDFTQQSLQWVVSGYILTYGGFLLLGGRAADLLGRPPHPRQRTGAVRGLVARGRTGAQCRSARRSALCARARRSDALPGCALDADDDFQIRQGSSQGPRAWAAVSGLGGAAGVLFGGLLVEGPGWRWVLFVNIPFCVIAFFGAFALLKKEKKVAALAHFDALGAFLVTGGMLLLVYALVKAPDVGWGTTRTISELAGAGAMLAAFVANELHVKNPLVPMSILRVKGVAVADATQMLALAGFFSMFFS